MRSENQVAPAVKRNPQKRQRSGDDVPLFRRSTRQIARNRAVSRFSNW